MREVVKSVLCPACSKLSVSVWNDPMRSCLHCGKPLPEAEDPRVRVERQRKAGHIR